MPLPPPSSARRHYHTRTIEGFGYFREDGMWDLEAHLTDIKPYDFDSTDRGHVPAGEPVHDMWLRVTIDDSFEIREAEAVTDKGPYSICGSIAPAYEQLVGLTIGPGFKKKALAKLGGNRGCTHMTELLGTIGTVAYQTAYASRRRARLDHGLSVDEGAPTGKPRHLDSCHAMATDGPVVRDYWPEFYVGPDRQER